MTVAGAIHRVGWHSWVRRLALGPVAMAGIACAQSDPRPADPFTPEERLQYFLHRTFAWKKMALLGATSTVSHAIGGPSIWGDGSAGLASRYASHFGERLTRNTIELGLGLALHEDLRYKRSHETGIVARLRYATTHALLASVPDGSVRPAYSRFAAAFGGEFLYSRWTPRGESGGEIVRRATWSLLDRIPNSYLDEFTPDLVRIGRRVRNKFRRARPTPDQINTSPDLIH
jgi:hypothetical protein